MLFRLTPAFLSGTILTKVCHLCFCLCEKSGKKMAAMGKAANIMIK
jgi:hypothetical protein